jgi:Ca2+-binding RTX toxin-like protein
MTIFTGTSGDDSILGTGGPDDFHIEQGGEDSASGGAGIDVFYLGVGFDAGDRIDGGTGTDYLVLQGDYSAGVTLTADTLVNVETIQLKAGFSYFLSGFTDANISGGELTIDGSNLAAGQNLTIDASGVASGQLSIVGGQGTDSLTGGDGDDTLDGGQSALAILHGGKGDDTLVGSASGADIIGGGQGNDFITYGIGAVLAQGGEGDDSIGIVDPNTQSSATVDGGAGNDNLYVAWLGDEASVTGGDGDDLISIYRHTPAGPVVDGGAGMDTLQVSDDIGGTVLLSGEQFTGFEALNIQTPSKIVVDDAMFAKGLTVQVEMAPYWSMSFDAHAEKNASFMVSTADHNDTLIAGGGDDKLGGGKGNDLLIGNKGDDTLNGSYGADKLVGGAGDDLLTGGTWARYVNSADTLLGGAGDDSITSETAVLVKGGAGNDVVMAVGAARVLGNAGDDLITDHTIHATLAGGAGNDTIDGGVGTGDTIIGGTGQDIITGQGVFVFEKVADSLVGAADQIADASNSSIDLHKIDADTTQDGDQAFHVVDAFTGRAGELIESVDEFRHTSVVYGDVDGDGTADFEIDIGSDLDTTTFVL